MVGLKNDLALFSCPARSSGDLGIKLSETLCGAEISGKQRPVDIQQGDEGDVREVVPFGQHLGANQNTRPAAMDGGEMLLQRSFAAGGIAVDTRDRHLREQRRQGLLQLLGADPYRHQMRGAAGRTLARDRALAVAMVAAQMVLRLVQRIVTVAARAFRYPAAIVAQQRWRKAAAVKKQDHLVIRLQVLAHTANQRGRQARLQRLPFEIEHVLLGRARIARAFA